jgi:hypothetical protein
MTCSRILPHTKCACVQAHHKKARRATQKGIHGHTTQHHNACRTMPRTASSGSDARTQADGAAAAAAARTLRAKHTCTVKHQAVLRPATAHTRAHNNANAARAGQAHTSTGRANCTHHGAAAKDVSGATAAARATSTGACVGARARDMGLPTQRSTQEAQGQGWWGVCAAQQLTRNHTTGVCRMQHTPRHTNSLHKRIPAKMHACDACRIVHIRARWAS